jgi:hypothetical protein
VARLILLHHHTAVSGTKGTTSRLYVPKGWMGKSGFRKRGLFFKSVVCAGMVIHFAVFQRATKQDIMSPRKWPVIDALRKIIRDSTPPKLRPVLRLLKYSSFGLSYLLPTKFIIIPHNGGFFSNFNKVVQHLVLSLNHSGIRAMQVDWHINKKKIMDQFSFGRPDDGNIWEHFFEQLTFHDDSYMRCVRIAGFRGDSIHFSNAYDLYKPGQGWRQQYHSAFKKHICIKPHVLKKVDQVYSPYMAGKYCIGVHMRNEAHKVEQPNNKMPPFESYLSQVRDILRSQSREGVIFLATDVEDYVRRFKNAFNQALIVQPGVTRLPENPDGDVNRQLHYDNAQASLKLGEDVLVDCLLLSRCDIFVHTVSNVATAVGYINPGIPMIYCE